MEENSFQVLKIFSSWSWKEADLILAWVLERYSAGSKQIYVFKGFLGLSKKGESSYKSNRILAWPLERSL